jgi:hypothetical protein
MGFLSEHQICESDYAGRNTIQGIGMSAIVPVRMGHSSANVTLSRAERVFIIEHYFLSNSQRGVPEAI